MAGIYFHIPFCKRLCNYCDFHRSVKLQYMPQVLDRMKEEVVAAQDFLGDKHIRTIYFGGGTPSLADPHSLQSLIEQVKRLFDCSALEEITIEVNPDDVTEQYIEQLLLTDVNRVSLGVQSLDEEELRFMGRRHSAEQAVEAVRRLQRAGYDNISVDVIFGVEGFGEDCLRKTLDEVVRLGVQHVSAYHLTIEDGTDFGRRVAKGTMRAVEESCSETEFDIVHDVLTMAGFEHYEVSNFALPGRRSRHNSSYWTGDEYLGVGPGAHSFAGGVRRWCDQRVEEYVNGVEYGSERLSEQDCYNEYIMVSLRRVEGLSLDVVESRFGKQARQRVEQSAQPFLDVGWLKRDGVWLKIPSEKFLTSDSVISTLFEV